ncbi:MAG: hypothetical protein VKQ33_10310 [Candidatus Sericytochromatia bacterium]|nr:hypothetical protein [Candidatus Sericytochromatia bacterium]
MPRLSRPTPLLGALALATGCHAASPLHADLGARFVVEAGMQNLAAAGGQDWQTGVVTSPAVARARQAHVEAGRRRRAGLLELAAGLPTFRVLTTYPNIPAGWKMGSNTWPGLGLNYLTANITTAETPPNGLAASTYWNANQHIFAVTNNGRLLRVDANDPVATAVTRNLDSRAFTRSALALNPTCSRLYALSDSGHFFIVNASSNTLPILNAGNTEVETGSTAKFLAPLVDPILSATNGSKDVVWVPLNNGRVYKYVITNTGATSTHPTPTFYEVVPNGVTPLITNSEILSGWRLAAPITGLNGRLFAGDTAGVLHDYDTTTSTDRSYPLSETMGILAPPAIEVSDGSADFQDLRTHENTTTSPAYFEPVHAFVNVVRDSGPTCAWVNLVARTVNFSRPLFLDDSDTSSTREVFGNPHEYGYAFGSTTDLEIKADASSGGDGVTTVTTSGDTLPGGYPFFINRLIPATTGATGSGGATRAFLRFSSTSLPNKAIITGATLTLTAAETVTTYPPRVYRVGSTAANGAGTDGVYQRGTTNTWTATTTNQLDADTQPVLFNEARAEAMTGGSTASTTTFTAGSTYTFDVTPLLGGPIKQRQWAFALAYEGLPAGHSVVYPGGTVSGTNYAAPEFYNPRDGSNANVPKLTITYKTLTETPPSQAPTTHPIIDATRKRVYCYDNNYLFCLNFTSVMTWTDTTRTDLNTSGTPHTGYQAAYWGRTEGAAGNNVGFHRTWTNPAVAYDFSSIYVLSRAQRGGGSSNGEIALSRIQPDRTGNQTTGLDLGGTYSPAAGADRGTADSSSPVCTVANAGDPGAGTLGNGTNPFPLANVVSRYMLIDPYSNVFTTGGDLYLGLQAQTENVLVRLGTE